eukprot:TRINITY_DN3858_c0_g1_i9.p1 TRINITY_DN3858_c0_g1~~TRINITY_DN3858_c0_g1_i9.p1  ORF type:complete len:549 (+),score=162.40 TRINITY_DN3858_c0_g1_i9:84-1649(+)
MRRDAGGAVRLRSRRSVTGAAERGVFRPAWQSGADGSGTPVCVGGDEAVFTAASLAAGISAGTDALETGDHQQVERYARREPRKRSLRQSMALAEMEVGIGSLDVPQIGQSDSCIQLACFVREEVLIRIALTLLSFLRLPRTVAAHPLIHQVFMQHWDNFRAIVKTARPETAAAERDFAEFLSSRMAAHAQMLGDVSQGFREVRRSIEQAPRSAQQQMLLDKMDSFLDVYIAQRLSRRVLAQHYLFLRQQKGPDRLGAGIFDPQCCPSRIVGQAAEVTEDICISEFGISPPVEFDGDTAATIPYVSSHLWYVAREMLKNAMRATVEHHGGAMAVELPPIRVTTLCGQAADSDLWVVIADRGGGMAPSKLSRSWSYGVTDFRSSVRDLGIGTEVSIGQRGRSQGQGDEGGGGMVPLGGIENSDTDARRLAGHGFGLPLSRNYLRFFGGDLRVRSTEGCGTQVFLRLRPLCVWSEDIELLAPASAGGPLRPPQPPAPSASDREHRTFLQRYSAFVTGRLGRPH